MFGPKADHPSGVVGLGTPQVATPTAGIPTGPEFELGAPGRTNSQQNQSHLFFNGVCDFCLI